MVYDEDTPPLTLPRSITIVPLGANHDAVRQICVKLLPVWSKFSADDLQVSTISGGITNCLVKVTPAPVTGLDPVVVRIFGRNTDMIIDREEELRRLLELNKMGFGAKVLGVFGNGRIEEFLTGRVVELDELQLPEVQQKIAARLAEFHKLLSISHTKACTFWDTLASWLEQAENLTLEDPQQQAAVQLMDFKQYQADINTVKATLDSLKPPVVLSHNDLLHANIMLMNDGSLQFIDFEYGGTNYRGFDLGNHFNEFAGLSCDYSRYPPAAVQANYARAYLCTEGAMPTDDQVHQLVVEANVSALASHLYWGLWALIQAKYSSIDFNYVEYSQMRYAEFKKRRDEFLSMAVLRN